MAATYHETLLGLGRMASATRRVGLGTAVFLLPLRNPVEAAKALASFDVLSGGRLILGLGVGWLAEEFEALGIDFRTRGTRFDEGVEVLRRLWSGDERPYEGRTVRLPAGVICRPFPFGGEAPRLLMGGDSAPALRRARQLGGWLGITHAANPDLDAVSRALDRLGPRADDFAVSLRMLGTASAEPGYAPRHSALRAMGVDLFILDVPWTSLDDAHDATADLVARLR
jgi:alkanesulfonate monooxygenase SsuD/methylene tetrahydromethanopterin reductase-like flavin-dependent oxidoreductase (luciferase family)